MEHLYLANGRVDAELHAAVIDPIALYGTELQEINIAPPNWCSYEELSMRLVGLKRAVTALRKLEASFDFQAELLVDAARVARRGLPVETFAYGSTPLRSFLALFACDTVAARLARSDPQRHTPHGLAPLAVRRARLVARLARLLRRVRRRPAVRGRRDPAAPLPDGDGDGGRRRPRSRHDRVRFENADMLTHDLRGADIVMLASQCWDDAPAPNSQASC